MAAVAGSLTITSRILSKAEFLWKGLFNDDAYNNRPKKTPREQTAWRLCKIAADYAELRIKL